MKPVIICGGVGTKMWPLSSPSQPKHFLPLISDQSLFEMNYQMVKRHFEPGEIFVSTNREQKELVKKYAPEVPEENLILEPSLQDTGPAIGLVAAELYRRGFKDETFVIVQTDIMRRPEKEFIDTLKQIDLLVQKHHKWVTGAIRPPFAMMGVDYMISGEVHQGVADLREWLMGTNKLEVEKWVKSGKAWLHANHYAATPQLWLDSYRRWKPEWGEPLSEIANGKSGMEIYSQIPKGRTEEWTKISVTKGEGMMVELPFEWRDFGTWESVATFMGEEEARNVVEIDADNNFVRTSGKPVAIIGLSDLVVIEGEAGVLVCRKSDSGKVGEVVKRLKEKG